VDLSSVTYAYMKAIYISDVENMDVDAKSLGGFKLIKWADDRIP